MHTHTRIYTYTRVHIYTHSYPYAYSRTCSQGEGRRTCRVVELYPLNLQIRTQDQTYKEKKVRCVYVYIHICAFARTFVSKMCVKMTNLQ